MAAESPLLEAKRRVDYFELGARTYIARCDSPRMPFRHTINPYRGCEFACRYCYARYTHGFMELRDPLEFEQKIFAKRWNPVAFRAELAKIPREEMIAIGTATDPYQPSERRYGVTRSILRVFAGEHGRKLGITTKSDLVSRDLDLLCTIARANVLHVSITVTTTDAELARKMEPYAPRPELRLEALQQLVRAGLSAGVFMAPALPYINDSELEIDRVASAAASAGASYFAGGSVFLREEARQMMFPWIDEHFPHLSALYRRRFTGNAYLDDGYREKLAARMESARELYRLPPRPFDYHPELWSGEQQLSLFTL